MLDDITKRSVSDKLDAFCDRRVPPRVRDKFQLKYTLHVSRPFGHAQRAQTELPGCRQLDRLAIAQFRLGPNSSTWGWTLDWRDRNGRWQPTSVSADQSGWLALSSCGGLAVVRAQWVDIETGGISLKAAMISRWTIWTDCNQEQASIGRLRKVGDLMGRTPTGYELDAYPKTRGHKLSFEIALEATSWNDAVVECIDLGQRVAHGWGLTGPVLDDAGASSSSTSVAGVVMIAWQLHRSYSRRGWPT